MKETVMTENIKRVWKPVRVHGCRKLDRAVAQHNMKQEGMRRINKPGRSWDFGTAENANRGSKRSGSVFSDKWRQYI